MSSSPQGAELKRCAKRYVCWPFRTFIRYSRPQSNRCTRFQINEKLGLEQIRRSTILAFLAALYIPLAFASVCIIPVSRILTAGSSNSDKQSIFSMNMTDPALDGAFQNITNTTRDANATNPFTLNTQTELLAHVISASGAVTYSWLLFIGIAVALVAGSFILPVIIGPIVRLALQSIVEYRAYWRLVYPTMLALWVIVAYIMLPTMGVIAFQDEYDTMFLFAPVVQLSFQLLLPAVAFFSIFQGRGPFRWFKGRQGKRSIGSIRRRLCFVGISIPCALYSNPFYTYDGPSSIIIVGFIPLLILLWVLAGRSIRRSFVRTWSKMRRRQSWRSQQRIRLSRKNRQRFTDTYERFLTTRISALCQSITDQPSAINWTILQCTALRLWTHYC